MTISERERKHREPIEIYRLLLDAADDTGKAVAPSSDGTRDLEILFYGMFCFHPDGDGYRVLMPNGMQSSGGVPAHAAAVWVRSRSEVATARWPWLAWRNDFFIGDAGLTLTIQGLVSTALNDTFLNNGYLTVLKELEPREDLRQDPDTVFEVRVDTGTLSVHEYGSKGMLTVRWLVQAPAGQSVRFDFGSNFVDVPPTAHQVILANAGSSHGSGSTAAHFRLYRKVWGNPGNDFHHQPPRKKTKLPGGVPEDPTFGYIEILTPDIVCSPVQSKIR